MIKKSRPHQRRQWFCVMTVMLVFVVTLAIKKQQPDLSTPVPEPLDEPVTLSETTTDTHLQRHITVKSGDTLHSIFASLEIPQHDFWKLVNTYGKEIKTLHPGEQLDFSLNQEHQLEQLRIRLSKQEILLFTRQENGFDKEQLSLPTQTVTRFREGKIDSSFNHSAQKAQIPADIYEEMVKIFAGTINFSRDLRQGDYFAVVYQEEIVDGQDPTPSHIIAAEMTAKHKTHQAVYFEDPQQHSGYYTPEGKGIEGRFLSFPLTFKRISSHFSRHRLDPVTHKVQPHSGIDLAAREGTPIRSIGNGRVIFIGQSRGYGNMIKIQYDRHYTALYAHMSRFAKHLQRLQHVHKGQVIGYVGHTGWATGPHLHFGFYVNGVAQDWLSLKHPKTLPVARQYREAFKAQAAKELATLKSHRVFAGSAALAENSAAAPKTVSSVDAK